VAAESRLLEESRYELVVLDVVDVLLFQGSFAPTQPQPELGVHVADAVLLSVPVVLGHGSRANDGVDGTIKLKIKRQKTETEITVCTLSSSSSCYATRDRPVDGHDNRTHGVLRPLPARYTADNSGPKTNDGKRDAVTARTTRRPGTTRERTGARER